MPPYRRLPLFLMTLWTLSTASLLMGQEIPPELMEDEHFRAEFGLSDMTTPSIRKIFGELDSMGDLPYEAARREIPGKTPTDRTDLALSMGGLIADGFFVVHTGRLKDLEDVGRSILKHASAMAAGERITSHTKSLLEHSTNGAMEELKEELARTQADVEVEMVQLRDVDAVHLIGFGGWLRAFEVAVIGALEPEFSAEEAEVLKRVEIVDYYAWQFDYFDPRLAEKENIQQLVSDVKKLLEMVTVEEETPFTEEQVRVLHAHVQEMADRAFAPRIVPEEEEAEAAGDESDEAPAEEEVEAPDAS